MSASTPALRSSRLILPRRMLTSSSSASHGRARDSEPNGCLHVVDDSASDISKPTHGGESAQSSHSFQGVRVRSAIIAHGNSTVPQVPLSDGFLVSGPRATDHAKGRGVTGVIKGDPRSGRRKALERSRLRLAGLVEAETRHRRGRRNRGQLRYLPCDHSPRGPTPCPHRARSQGAFPCFVRRDDGALLNATNLSNLRR